MLGEKVAHAAIFLHLYILSYTQVQRYPSLWQLHANIWDFSDGVFRVMKIS